MNELAERVQQAGTELGLRVEIQALIANPGRSARSIYYCPTHSGLLELGLEPHLMTDDVVGGMIEKILPHRNRIDATKIMPRVRWNRA